MDNIKLPNKVSEPPKLFSVKRKFTSFIWIISINQTVKYTKVVKIKILDFK